MECTPSPAPVTTATAESIWGNAEEQFELFSTEYPAGLEIIADKSQLHSVIIFDEQKRGSINSEKLKCRGLKSMQCLKFLLLRIYRTLVPQFPTFLHSISFVDCALTNDNVVHLLEILRTSGEHLTSLDLSHNLIGSTGAQELAVYLTEVGLKQLNLSKNQLCDVWTSRGITAGAFNTDGLCHLLLAIASAAARGQNNEGCLQLEYLDISRNMIGQDDALMTSLCGLIERNIDSLTILNLTGNYFDQENMTDLMASMKRNIHIMSYCGPIVSTNHKKLLNLASCNLAPFDFLFLNPNFEQSKAKSQSQSVCAVDFSWNREFGIGNPSFPLDGFPFVNLHSLRLVNIGMDTDYAANLRVVLENPSCSLTSLDVAGNASTLENEGFNHLLTGMKRNTSLQYLSLLFCVPRCYRSYHLIKEALEANTTLRELNLSQSHGCRFDAGPVFLALKTNTTLQTLRLSRCEINAAGITFLNEMIDKNKTLTCLDLSHNFICKFGWDKDYNTYPALSFIVALRHLNADADPKSPSLEVDWAPVSYIPPSLSQTCSLLRELDLSHNKMEDGVMAGLAEALKNRALNIDTLNLSFCGIGLGSGQVLGLALPHVTCLKTLLLGHNALRVVGIESILEGLTANTSIRVLDLSANNLSRRINPLAAHNQGAMVIKLKTCLSQNTCIEHIDLRKNALFGDDTLANEYWSSSMTNLGAAIKANANNEGRLVSLNILDNAYHNCSKCSKASKYWSPVLYSDHLKNCASCPAVWLHSAVHEMKEHPTMMSLFGIDPAIKSLKLEVGSSASSPIMWALFSEISRHQRLQCLDLSSFFCKEAEAATLSDWFATNSLLRTLKLSRQTYGLLTAFLAGCELSFEGRMSAAVFVRGCSHLGSAAVRGVVEFLYGEGPQSQKFLKYKAYSDRGVEKECMGACVMTAGKRKLN